MPTIHPSEDPPLGWLVPCLNCTDIAATLALYGALDFEIVGGDQSKGWLCLRNRGNEIHLFQGHITQDVINFRGGDVRAICTALSARGLTPKDEPVDQADGCTGANFFDPDGRELFFDTHPDEAARYQAGAPVNDVIEGDPFEGGGMLLGNLTWCFDCADLAATSAFYAALGLPVASRDPQGSKAIHARADHVPVHGQRTLATYLSLFGGVIPADTLNFRGGDVGAIAARLKERGVDLGDGVQTGADGGESLLLLDADGRAVFLDTTPPERLY